MQHHEGKKRRVKKEKLGYLRSDHDGGLGRAGDSIEGERGTRTPPTSPTTHSFSMLYCAVPVSSFRFDEGNDTVRERYVQANKLLSIWMRAWEDDL